MSLEKDISNIKKRLKQYDDQERRLVSIIRYKDLPEDYVLDEMKKLKSEKLDDVERLKQLELLKKNKEDIERAEIRLDKFEKIVKNNLDKFTTEDKKQVLDALQVKVMVNRDQIEIKAVVPIDLVTTEQTSA